MNFYFAAHLVSHIFGVVFFITTILLILKQRFVLKKNKHPLEKTTVSFRILNALIDQVSDCVLLIDEKGMVVHGNLQFLEYFGKPLEKIIGKNIQWIPSDYLHHDHSEKLKASIEEKNFYECDIKFFHENGETIPFHVKVFSFITANGKFYGVVASDKKISNEKDHFIKQQENELLEIQHLAHIGYWEIDHLTKKIYWSKELYSILGYEEGEIEPNLNLLYSMVAKKDRYRVNKAFCKSFQYQEKTDTEYLLINNHQKILVVYLRIRHLFSEKNEHLGTIGILQDITKQTNLEEELKEQLLFSDTILDYTSILYVAVNQEIKIININDNLYQLLGFKKENIIGKTLIEAFGKINSKQLRFIKKNVEFKEAMPLVDFLGKVHYIQWDSSIFVKKNQEIITTFWGLEISDIIKKVNTLETLLQKKE